MIMFLTIGLPGHITKPWALFTYCLRILCTLILAQRYRSNVQQFQTVAITIPFSFLFSSSLSLPFSAFLRVFLILFHHVHISCYWLSVRLAKEFWCSRAKIFISSFAVHTLLVSRTSASGQSDCLLNRCRLMLIIDQSISRNPWRPGVGGGVPRQMPPLW